MDPLSLRLDESPLYADLCSRLRTSDLLQWIEGQAEELLSDLPCGPTIFSSKLLRARNIRQIVFHPEVRRARIVASTGAFEIHVNPRLPRVAQRFAVAHEIGHTFWFASLKDTTPLSPVQWRSSRDAEIELLCDRFAAALLLPQRWLETWVASHAGHAGTLPRFELLDRAARTFDVAPQAVARRLYVDLRQVPLAIVCLRRTETAPSLLPGDPQADVWETSWCAVPEPIRDAALTMDRVIPMKTRRRIPCEMLPSESGHFTVKTTVDGRWLKAVMPQTRADARRRLSTWSTELPIDAYVWRSGSQSIVGLELPKPAR